MLPGFKAWSLGSDEQHAAEQCKDEINCISITQQMWERSTASTIEARYGTSEQQHRTWCRHQLSTISNWSCQLHPDSVHQSTVCTSCSLLPQHSRSVFEGRISQATVLPKITYCLPAWSGLSTAADRTRLNSFLRWCVKLGYYSSNDPLLTM